MSNNKSGKLELVFHPIKKGEEYSVSLNYDPGVIEDIIIPSTYNGLPVTAIKAEGFNYSVKSVKIPDSIKSIGHSAFRKNENLKSIDLPKSITGIGWGAFKYCGLTSIDIPEKVKSIGNPQAFSGCVDLESIEVSPNNKTLKAEGNCLIEIKTGTLLCGCKASVIPDYVKIIDRHAFYECVGLTEIVIPDSVTTIGDFAFGKCSNLTRIILSAGVNLKGFAFNDCNNLNKVFFRGSASEWEVIDKKYNEELTKAKVEFIK